jgi:hypothetical protein
MSVVCACVLPLVFCGSQNKMRSTEDSQNSEIVVPPEELLKAGELEKVCSWFRSADQHTLDSAGPKVLSLYLEASHKKAFECYQAHDMAGMYGQLKQAIKIPYFHRLLDTLSALPLNKDYSLPYEQVTISKFISFENLTGYLGNYLIAFLSGRHTKAYEEWDEQDAKWVSEVLGRCVDGFKPLNVYLDETRNEELVRTMKMREVQARCRYDVTHDPENVDSCMRTFAAIDSQFSSRFFPDIVRKSIILSPDHLFTKDTIVVEIAGRPFSAFAGSMFDAWYDILVPALGFYVPKKTSDGWIDRIAYFSRAKGTSVSGKIFGRYDANAIAAMYKTMVPDPATEVCGVSMGTIYEKIFAKTVRLFALCRVKLASMGIAKETESYSAAMKSPGFDGRQYLKQQYNETEIDGIDDKKDVERVPRYMGFWLRRSMDGSGEALWSVFSDFIKRYDNGFYQAVLAPHGIGVDAKIK